ncbi:MAG: translocation/assembly module TamB domain-containing protein [Planctomycetota bacterium]|nr:translocation/assembly module TamB domain-containing protein [Planctomycetota bacterium]
MEQSGENNQPSPALGGALRWARRAALVLALLVAAALGLYGTRERTLHPLLVRSAPTLSRWFSPFEVRLVRIEGDWLDRLAIEGLELRARAGAEGPLRGLEVERAEVRGDLLAAAIERDPSALEAVTADAPRVQLDLASGAGSEGEESGPRWPALPHLDVTRGSVRLEGLDETLDIEHLELTGRGSSGAPLELAGELRAPEWSAHLLGRLRFEDGGALRFVLDAPEARAGGIDAAIIGVAGSWTPDGAELDEGRVVVGTSELEFSGIRVVAGGARRPQVGGEVRFRLPDLGEAHRALSAVTGAADARSWSGSAAGSATLSPDPDGITVGSIDLRGADVVVSGIELGGVAARAEASGQGIELTSLEASTARGARVKGRGRYDFSERSLAATRLEIRLDQPGDLDEGLALVRGVEIDLDVEGPVDELAGAVALRAAEVELTPGALLRDVNVEGTLSAGTLRLAAARIDTPYGAAQAEGTVTLPLDGRALGVRLDSLQLSGRDGDLRLMEAAHIELGGLDSPRVEGLVLEGSAGRASLDLRSGDALRITLDARELRLAPFLPGPTETAAGSPWRRFLGPITGAASFDGAAGAGEVDLSMPLPGSPEVARIDARWDGVTAEVRSVDVAIPGARFLMNGSAAVAAGEVPLAGDGPVELSLEADLDSEALGWAPLQGLIDPGLLARFARADGSARLAIELTGTWGAPRGSATVDLVDWVLADPDAPAGSTPPRPIKAKTRLVLAGDLRVESGSVLLEDCVELSLGGRVEYAADLASLARDPAAALASLEGAEIEVLAELTSTGLEELNALVPELRDVAGRVEGELRFGGTVGAPVVTGDLSVQDGVARYRGAPTIEALQLDLHLEEEELRIERGSLELGASPVDFEGNVLLGQSEPRIDARIRGEEVLLARTENARIRADLDLEIHGRPGALTVGGDIELTGGRVRSPIEFRSLLEGSRGPRRVDQGLRIPAFGPPSVQLDARITTREPLALRGRIARGDIRVDMRLAGTAASPTPLGDIFLDPLELAVPAGTITFPSGVVHFDRARPDVPSFDVVGSTQLAGYDVTIALTGDYDQPEIELSSAPSLAPDELLLLVLSGRPPSVGGGLEAAGQSVALYVAKDLLQGWFTSGGFEEEDRESYLDRLEVVTGRDISGSGVLTIEGTYRLREGFARENDALYVVLERDSYEDYGLGLRLVLRLR